jgi:hypothetical protein
MLTAEDRKIRVVDSSLELLAQGIGNAISMRFPDRSIEQMLARSPSLKRSSLHALAGAACSRD